MTENLFMEVIIFFLTSETKFKMSVPVKLMLLFFFRKEDICCMDPSLQFYDNFIIFF